MPRKEITGEITEVRSCTGLLCLEWRIPRFLSLPAKDYYSSYYSPSFFFCDVYWCLLVFPNRNPSERVRVRFVREEGRIPCDSTDAFRFTVGMKSSAGVEKRMAYEFRFWQYSYVWDCVSRKELSEQKDTLMPDDALTIVCEMKMPKSAEATEELQSSLQSLDGEECDVTVKVGDKEFRAHRLIMRWRSPVFRAMFSHDTLEKQKGVVTMDDDTDPETFPAFLEHLYTGSVRMISADNVVDLFVLSDKYDLKTLRKGCTRFMSQNMTAASFCDVVSVAVRHDEEELMKRAADFFSYNCADIIETVQWQIFKSTKLGHQLLYFFYIYSICKRRGLDKAVNALINSNN